MLSRPTVLAVDIGATKMAAAAVDGEGRLGWRDAVATPADPDPEAVWDALAGLLAAAPGGAVACGVGCAGPIAPGGATVSPVNVAGWRDFPLHRRLEQLTGLPTSVEVDAKALALGEGIAGAAQGRTSYLSMVVSTGVGGGVVLDGRLLDGRTGNAGHIGHVVVEPEGRICGCGGRGCLEAEASGTAIAAITGAPPALAGPAIVERVGTLVGRAVGSVANLLDLDLATVAGSVALGYGAPFFAAATAELELRCRIGFAQGCRIVASPLGADAPLVGAAAVAWRSLERAAVPDGRGARSDRAWP
jgi:glucokinase